MMRRFTPLYILANLGAHVAFLPLLVLLLPRRVDAISAGEPIILLSKLLLLGGITASFAHIAAGWISDRWIARHGNRRVPIGFGLLLLLASYAYFSTAQTPLTLAIAIVAFQLSLNMMFSPIGALLADHVPHENKGWIAGWLNMALPLAGLAITLIGLLGDRDEAWPFMLLAAFIAACVLPLLLAWPGAMALVEKQIGHIAVTSASVGRDFVLAWIARLTIQTGAALMLSYLFLYVEGLTGSMADYPLQSPSEGVAALTFVATVISLGAGLIAGRWSDRVGVRKQPLIVTALGVALALGLLAWAANWWLVVAAYALFTASLTAFLSVDSAMVAQLLAGHSRRGTFLGLMNLTNTLPAIIAPSAALLLSTSGREHDILRALLGLGVVAGIAAAFAISGIRSVR